ncbi:AraC family transcriptional regulator [Acaryochloris marina]|uniref:AraC family transcriptional regulator n=1 Tax=Acaryochloris marina TaxID=155978 RepID=UPI0021C2F535|nr:AraC family transcriptional regulator [Acaryochloris marina]
MTQQKSHSARVWLIQDNILEFYHYAPGPPEAMPNHSHDYYQLCLSIGGTDSELYYRGAYHSFPINSLSIVHPGEMHKVRQIENRPCNSSQWLLFIRPSLMHQVATSLDGGCHTNPFFSKMLVLDSDLIQAYLLFCHSIRDATSMLEQDSRLITLLSQLIQRWANVRSDSSSIELPHQQIQTARTYLEEHFAENVTLEHLAQIAHLSPYHLNRVFSQTVGLPPHKYRLQVQIKRARSLLIQGMPIKQVAVETGFADQSHFTRHFKRLVRVTPGQYQIQDRKNVQGFVS